MSYHSRVSQTSRTTKGPESELEKSHVIVEQMSSLRRRNLRFDLPTFSAPEACLSNESNISRLEGVWENPEDQEKSQTETTASIQNCN